MDVFEKLNKAFAGWYESLFGDSASDVRPKDVLRKIITAMEDNRKEGLDNRIYVPNKYILEISFENDEEREYLLAFLDKIELEAALRKYTTQNKYFMRGPLDFTLEEMPPVEGDTEPEKLCVKCKWDIRAMESTSDAESAASYVIAGLAEEESPSAYDEDDEHTVASVDFYDACTVAPPLLNIRHIDGSTEQYLLTKSVTVIGRSKRLNNDLVIDKDGMISKNHAKVVREGEHFKIVDMGSTNGVWLNGERATESVLKSGDSIRVGATEMTFEDPTAASIPPDVLKSVDAKRPRLEFDRNGHKDDFRLPSETIIGRALVSDIRFENSAVSQRHARIFSANGQDFYIEDLGSTTGTKVNGHPLTPDSPIKLHQGDSITVGDVGLSYEVD